MSTLTDRERVNAAIKFNAMSTLVTVSFEHVEEMRDCLPPAFMGHKYPFHFVQVGEAADHKQVDGKWVEVYETYCTVSKEDKYSPLTTAYEFGQWYFIGIKPLIKN